jgi:CRP/FNR family transcriptional regulator, cyclic AMP receptor protein
VITEPALSESARKAWETTFLSSIPAADAALLENAREGQVAAGEIIHRVVNIRSGGGVLIVVVDGLLRVFSGSAQGRELTVRYVCSGDVVGLPTVLAPEVMQERMHLAVQALTDTHILRLSTERFRTLLARDPSLYPIVCKELVRALVDTYEMLAEDVFAPVRQRVARHLLDLSVREGDRFVVHASQQTIADAIGSVREVVSRVVIQMRDQRLIDRIGDGYAIVDPAGLHRSAQPG